MCTAVPLDGFFTTGKAFSEKIIIQCNQKGCLLVIKINTSFNENCPEKYMVGKRRFGQDTFNTLGGVEGVRALANCFYDIMGEMPEARKIRDMHPENLGPTRENLTLFLCGWLGGPSLYKEKYGSINLTELHAPLEINVAERDMWLSCMEKALDRQAIEKDLKEHLLERFRIPAGKISTWCQQQFRPSNQLGNHGKL